MSKESKMVLCFQDLPVICTQINELWAFFSTVFFLWQQCEYASKCVCVRARECKFWAVAFHVKEEKQSKWPAASIWWFWFLSMVHNIFSFFSSRKLFDLCESFLFSSQFEPSSPFLYFIIHNKSIDSNSIPSLTICVSLEIDTLSSF